MNNTKFTYYTRLFTLDYDNEYFIFFNKDLETVRSILKDRKIAIFHLKNRDKVIQRLCKIRLGEEE